MFSSLEIFPPIWRTAALLNPLVYLVNGVRLGFLGDAEVDPNGSLTVLWGAAVVVLGVDVVLFKRGYRLTE